MAEGAGGVWVGSDYKITFFFQFGSKLVENNGITCAGFQKVDQSASKNVKRTCSDGEICFLASCDIFTQKMLNFFMYGSLCSKEIG